MVQRGGATSRRNQEGEPYGGDARINEPTTKRDNFNTHHVGLDASQLRLSMGCAASSRSRNATWTAKTTRGKSTIKIIRDSLPEVLGRDANKYTADEQEPLPYLRNTPL